MPASLFRVSTNSRLKLSIPSGRIMPSLTTHTHKNPPDQPAISRPYSEVCTSLPGQCFPQQHYSSRLKKGSSLYARCPLYQVTLKCTLGWKILVRYRTAGGTKGYCSGTFTSTSNTPPSYGVSLGPCTTKSIIKHHGCLKRYLYWLRWHMHAVKGYRCIWH